jgi:hypothetical protein
LAHGAPDEDVQRQGFSRHRRTATPECQHSPCNPLPSSSDLHFHQRQDSQWESVIGMDGAPENIPDETKRLAGNAEQAKLRW